MLAHFRAARRQYSRKQNGRQGGGIADGAISGGRSSSGNARLVWESDINFDLVLRVWGWGDDSTDGTAARGVLTRFGTDMNDKTQASDYLAPGVSELSKQHRVGGGIDLNAVGQDQITRQVAKRLLPACVVTPALLWWVLIFGVHRGWYDLDTCLIVVRLFGDGGVWGDRLLEPAEVVADGCAAGAGRRSS